MSPEILNKTLNDQSFESYKAADIYALGLVFWEILRRCQTTADGLCTSITFPIHSFESFLVNDADPYQLPYEDVLPNNPSFEQMHGVVYIKKLRPSSSARWTNNPVTATSFIFQLNYLTNSCMFRHSATFSIVVKNYG